MLVHTDWKTKFNWLCEIPLAPVELLSSLNVSLFNWVSHDTGLILLLRGAKNIACVRVQGHKKRTECICPLGVTERERVCAGQVCVWERQWEREWDSVINVRVRARETFLMCSSAKCFVCHLDKNCCFPKIIVLNVRRPGISFCLVVAMKLFPPSLMGVTSCNL